MPNGIFKNFTYISFIFFIYKHYFKSINIRRHIFIYFSIERDISVNIIDDTLIPRFTFEIPVKRSSTDSHGFRNLFDRGSAETVGQKQPCAFLNYAFFDVISGGSEHEKETLDRPVNRVIGYILYPDLSRTFI